jgi:hypothetical protein
MTQENIPDDSKHNEHTDKAKEIRPQFHVRRKRVRRPIPQVSEKTVAVHFTSHRYFLGSCGTSKPV